MEAEFKFKIEDKSIIEKIINDSYLDKYVDREHIEDIAMHAVYFDTADGDLRRAKIAYRVRHENDRITATIKWAGSAHDGFHSREEFNLVINDEGFADNPNIDVFESSEAYEVLRNAAGDKPLHKVVEMNFNRKLMKIDTGMSISALSFDEGKIIGKENESDVCEMEIEWYHGDEDDFKDIAIYLAGKYDLAPENETKLQRGFLEEYDGK